MPFFEAISILNRPISANRKHKKGRCYHRTKKALSNIEDRIGALDNKDLMGTQTIVNLFYL
jgi:hypothetical protein